MDDTAPELRETHIGTLVRLTPKIIRRLTPGNSYYIVIANGWFRNYDGSEPKIQRIQSLNIHAF